MATLAELLANKNPELPNKLKEVAEKSDLNRLLTTPMSSSDIDSLNSKPEVLDRMSRAAQGDYSPPVSAAVDSGLAVPVGEAKTISADPEVLKHQFAMLKNRPELVGDIKDESPSKAQLKHMFKGGDKPVSPVAEDIDDSILNEMNKVEAKSPAIADAMSSSKPAAAAEEATSGMSGLMSKLSGLSDESLSKLGPIGKKIMESRAAAMIENAVSSPAGKLIGKALPIGAAALETKNALQNTSDGKYLDASMNATGAGAGLASFAGSAAAGPLAAVAGGYGAGKLYRDLAGMGDDLPPARPQDPNAPVTTPPVVAPNQYGPSPLPPALAAKPQVERDEEDDSEEGPSKGGKQTVSHASSSDTRLAATGSAEQQAIQNLVNSAGFSNNTVENLKAVQDAANKQKNMADMMKAVNQISSGLTGAAYHTGAPSTAAADKFQDDQKAEADNSIKQFQDLTEKEKDDPNSSYSASMRAFAKPLMAKLNIKLPDNMSAAQMATVSPMLVKMFDAKQTDETNRLKAQELNETRRMHDALLSESRDGKKTAQADEKTTKRLDTLGKMITSEVASSRSQFGKDATNIGAVQNAKALLSGGNLDDIDNRQIAETARVLDRILSGGNATISGTEHLTPDTARMKIAKMMEFATNQRQGAGASDFLQNIQHTLDREETTARNRIRNTSQALAGSYMDIAKKNPEAWDTVMAQHNLLDVLGSKALEARSAGGIKNLSEYGKSSASTAPASDGMVKVISPSGVQGMIPKSKLQEALGRKFKVVE